MNLKIIICYITVLLLFLVVGELSITKGAGATFTDSISSQVVQTGSKAVIFFDGQKETILDSFTFNLNPLVVWNFAWVIPVPSKPDVELIKDEIFTKLDKITQKKVEKDTFWKRVLFFDIEEEKNIPSEVFTRPIDIIRPDVIGPPNQMEKLNNWLSYYGFLIPKEGRQILMDYQEKGWYFVVVEINALHLQMDASESLTIPGAHIFPIKISFPTDKIIYPLKLVSIQPDYDTVDIPLNYSYGTKSEDVLGEKSEKIDDVLSEQSKNKYPRLPLDYANFKVELFIFDAQRTQAKDFTTIYANWINEKDISFKDFAEKEYFRMPKKTMFLTRLVTYKPFLQLEDVEIKKADSNQKLNAASLPEQYAKVGGITLAASSLVFWKLKRRRL